MILAIRDQEAWISDTGAVTSTFTPLGMVVYAIWRSTFPDR